MLRHRAAKHGGLFSGNKESSKSYREGTAQKWKSMALPYKTKVLKKTLIEFYVDGIEIGDNPIGPKCLPLL